MPHIGIRCLGLLALLAAVAAPQSVVVEHDVGMKTREGITLRADIYRPKADGKFPVLLKRTPYSKDKDNADFATHAAALGYVVIIQDVRGRFASEGEWYPFKFERFDGYDTVEWAAALPFTNGKVGMFGNSYVGATQLLAAMTHPPHLAGIMPGLTASNYHDGWTYQGGAFLLWFNESWSSELAEDTLNRHLRESSHILKWIWKLPVSDYPFLDMPALSSLAPYFADWLHHSTFDEYWRQWSIEDHYRDIRVPAYHVGGWYDIFQMGSVRNYVGLKNSVAGQRLLIGPWYHGHFGAEGEAATNAEILRWYDHLLRGLDNGIEREKPVKILVLGTNSWRQEDDWPLARACEAHYYLHSEGNAATRNGDGDLSIVAPAREQPDRYTYDPADPVPTRGGGLCCKNDLLPAGPVDQGAVEDRRDVLVYSTATLSHDLEVTGPIALELYISSSAIDTDFTASSWTCGPMAPP
jgi:putative CocE/NonD family hydrolase